MENQTPPNSQQTTPQTLPLAAEQLAAPVKKSNSLVLGIAISLLVAIVSLATAAYFAYENYQMKREAKKVENVQKVAEVSTPQTTETPQPTADPFADWETYSDETYTFKYPINWILVPGGAFEEEYFGNQDVVKLYSPNEKVGLFFYPSVPPYGFGGPMDETTNTINISIGQNFYDATETVYSFPEEEVEKKRVYTSLSLEHKNNDYYILFGSGYPVTSDLTASYPDYLEMKETLLKILSTFEFTDQAETTDSKIDTLNWETYSNSTYNFSLKHPAELIVSNRIAFNGTSTIKAVPITAFEDPSTVVPESDALFNSFSLGYLTLESSFDEYIQEEVEALENQYQSLWRKPGNHREVTENLGGKTVSVILSDNDAFKTYYVELNPNNYLVIKTTESNADYTKAMKQIISSIRTV